jgi:hypothetical protein
MVAILQPIHALVSGKLECSAPSTRGSKQINRGVCPPLVPRQTKQNGSRRRAQLMTNGLDGRENDPHSRSGANAAMCWYSLKWSGGVFRWRVFPPFGRGFSRHRYDHQAIPQHGLRPRRSLLPFRPARSSLWLHHVYPSQLRLVRDSDTNRRSDKWVTSLVTRL